MKLCDFNKSNLIKAVFFVFALIFFMSPVFAAEEFLSEKWLFNGDSFVANGNAFILHMDYNTIIYVSSDSGSVGIPQGSCGKINVTKICFNMSTFDIDKRDMKAKILVFSVKPTIKVYRQISKQFMYVDEEAIVSVSINNSGGSAAVVDYFDEFPDSVQLMYPSGCIIDGHTVKWSGMIGKDSGYTCSFTIKPKDELYRGLKARAVYYDGQEIKTVYSESITVDARQFLVLTATTRSSSLLNGQLVNLTLNLTSRYDKKLNDELASDVEIVIPESMIFYSSSDESLKKITNNTYGWNVTLYKNNTAQTIIQLRSKRIGISEVVVKTSYETNLGNFSLVDRLIPFTITGKDLILTSEIKKGAVLETELETGEEYSLTVYIQNPNQYIGFENVNITFFTNLTHIENVVLPYLNSSSQRIPVNIIFVAPSVLSTTSYPFNINVNYTTEFGDYSYSTLRKSISVRSPETPSINYVLTPSSGIESKDELRMKVQVKNPRKIGISNVKIKTTIPEAFKVNGVSDIIANINSASTLDAYELKITAPRTSSDKNYVFNTTVSYVDEATGKHIFTYREQTLKITQKQIKLSYTRRVSDLKIFKNKIIQLDHIITSNDNDEFQNLIITFPIQKYVDVVNSVNYPINKISPGEKIILTGIENIRVKEKNSMTLEPVTIRYHDIDGDYSNSTFGSISLSLASTGYSEQIGPSLVVDKKISVANVDRSNAQNATIVVTITNIGDEVAEQVYLSDEFRQMALADIAQGMQINVTYNISSEEIKSSGLIKRSIVSYFNPDKTYNYYTASEDLVVSVVEPAAVMPAKETIEPVSDSESNMVEQNVTGQATEPSSEPVQETVQKKGFFANLWDSIKKILFWKRE